MGYLVYRFALLLGISPLFVVLESTLGLKLRLRSYSAERFREPRSPSSYLSRMVRYVDTAFLFEASRRVLGGEWRANGTFLDAVVGTLRLGDIAGFWIMGFDGATDALTPTLFVRREFTSTFFFLGAEAYLGAAFVLCGIGRDVDFEPSNIPCSINSPKVLSPTAEPFFEFLVFEDGLVAWFTAAFFLRVFCFPQIRSYTFLAHSL